METSSTTTDVEKLNINGTSVSSSDNQLGKGDAANVASTPAKKRPEDFRFGKLIGEGSFSSVYLAKDISSGNEFAIKVCNKQHIIKERKSDSVRREKDAMTILSANRNPKVPFFVRLYATFQDPERLYFVMTFGRGGELLKYLQKLKTFNRDMCRFYAGEIVLALAHLHGLLIVHRDLKPENILLGETGHILITDFGSAKILKTDAEKLEMQPETEKTEHNPLRVVRNNSFVGTAQYVSPEILQGRYSEVGPPADLWALGCVLFQLATGTPPFNGPNEYLIFQKILNSDYAFPSDFDSSTRDLIESLLKMEPLERLGAQDTDRYNSIQSHTFFEEIDFDTLFDQTPPILASDPPFSPTTQHHVPDTIEPGFDPRVIATRALQEDGLEIPDVNVNINIAKLKTNEDITNRNNKPVPEIKKSQPELFRSPSPKVQTKTSCCTCTLI